MHKLLMAVLVLGCCSLPAMAQDHSKVEVFGGYQFTHLGSGISPVVTANGWDSSFTFNINNTVGLTGDFSGAYQTVSGSFIGASGSYPGRYYTYAGGPAFSFNSQGKVKPFLHVLVGAVRVSSSASAGGVTVSASKTGLASIFGGGVDLKLNKSVSLRLVQVDWGFYHFTPSAVTTSGTTLISSGVNSAGNFKVATGVLFTF